MSDVYEHNPDDHEDPLTGPSWYVGLVGALILVVTLLGLTALYYNERTTELQKKVVAEFPADLEKLRDKQAEQLSEPPHREVRDEAGQEVTALVIPIEDAMQIMVKELDNRGGTQ